MRSSAVQDGSSADGRSAVNASAISVSRKFAAIGTRSMCVDWRSTLPRSSISTYKDSAGGDVPARSVNAATSASGSIVSLRPGM